MTKILNSSEHFEDKQSKWITIKITTTSGGNHFVELNRDSADFLVNNLNQEDAVFSFDCKYLKRKVHLRIKYIESIVIESEEDS